MTTKKNETMLKEVSDLVQKDFPEFWINNSDTNIESRKNTIDVYYKVRMRFEEMSQSAGLTGYERQMHSHAMLSNVKAEFKFVLLNQQIESLIAQNAALESRLAALEQNKVRKTRQ